MLRRNEKALTSKEIATQIAQLYPAEVQAKEKSMRGKPRSIIEQIAAEISANKLALLKIGIKITDEHPNKYYFESGDEGNITEADFSTNLNTPSHRASPNNLEDFPRNIIIYGPPGTGKSHKIHNEYFKNILNLQGNKFLTDHISKLKDQGTIETVTFHPEYTYFDFIGQYKPITINGIVEYRMVVGPLIRIIEKALKQPDQNFILNIEEINRGNCAAIFGDFFQLLDRDLIGNSKYKISLSEDLTSILKQSTLILPANFFIVSSMNTSDQSLFPMDSAFKRRWDMQYLPINYEVVNSKIEGTDMLWANFLKEINNKIFQKTEKEDKMMGPYFISEKNGLILEKDFKNKALEYLYNDVFKHNKEIFKKKDKKEILKYSELYSLSIKEIVTILIGQEHKNE